ncbi:MAG: hypothetical protein M0Z56_04890, partial [Desulfobacteraceae bacterium]|nr:hypothetical protein [Desulfobacteraceae bacterium]
YTPQKLEQMLQGRKNLTFIEPADWFARLIHTLFPKLILMPYTYRNMAQNIFKGLSQTLFAILCYGLTWFAGTTGLSTIQGTPILDWLALILTVYLVFVWMGIRKPLNKNLQQNANSTGTRSLVFWITVSVLLPFALMIFHRTVSELPELRLSTGFYIGLISILALVTMASFFFLLAQRMDQIDAKTEVSELRDNWQESIHPQEIFIHFESIVMANRRYKEIPNRVYCEFNAKLLEEGSNDKGHFKGEMIQETQPIFRFIQMPSGFNVLRTGLTIFGQLLLTVSALWLYRIIESVSELEGIKHIHMAQPFIMNSADIFLGVLIFWTFGSILSNYALAFWAEMQFESLLVYFKCQGTYTESKLSTGTSIYDSTRSENTVVRSSLTPWVIACRTVTCCFSGSGMRNLDSARHIIEMHKADDDLKAIISEIQGFMGNRASIAGFNSDKDIDAASKIYQINMQSRMGHARVADGKNPMQIDEERVLGHSDPDGHHKKKE